MKFSIIYQDPTQDAESFTLPHTNEVETFEETILTDHEILAFGFLPSNYP